MRPRRLLRAGGVGVHIVTGEAFDGGDQVGTDALRNEGHVVVGGRVGGPGAAVAAHRHARHRLHTTGEHQVVPAGTHLLCADVDGLQARGTETVELDTTGGVGQAGRQHRGAGDIATLVADRGHDTQHDIADQVLVQVGVTVPDLLDEADHQVQRLDLVESAATLLAARRTDGLVDECFSHGYTSLSGAYGGMWCRCPGPEPGLTPGQFRRDSPTLDQGGVPMVAALPTRWLGML